MAKRRGSFPARSSGVARNWGGGPGGTTLVSLSATGSSILGAGITSSIQLTVLRIRGLFHAYIIGGGTADGDGFFGAVGIGKCTAAAFAVGITAMETPITEANWDGWLWHSYFSVYRGDLDGGGNSESTQRIVIDSKAMRKFGDEEIIFAAVEVVETGTSVVGVRLDTRMLAQDSGR